MTSRSEVSPHQDSPSSSTTYTGASALPRRPIIIALILSIALTIGVLVGTKWLFGDGREPVALSALPAEQADSPQCSALLDHLPDELLGLETARLVEPAPAGAHAWSGHDNERITLRCGVDTPQQYTTLSRTEAIDGREWIRVTDATPGSTMQTWYLVSSSPTVAVTAEEDSLGSADNPVRDLNEALQAIDGDASTPNPAPLNALAAGSGNQTSCAAYLKAVPPVFEASGTSYRRLGGSEARAAGYGDDAVVWLPDNSGLEPIATRCGVAEPAGYAPGEALQQIDSIPWFNDTTLANGTTLGVWYPLGRDVSIAVSMPQDAVSTVAVDINAVVADTTREAAH